jgi:hypothetical protein
LMLALLRLTADSVALPPELESPLLDPIGPDEREYHERCFEAEAAVSA